MGAYSECIKAAFIVNNLIKLYLVYVVSGEHGIGFAKKPYLRESLDPETIELMSGIKKAFDPKNILNPHKVFQG